jgi:hypothetical protein
LLNLTTILSFDFSTISAEAEANTSENYPKTTLKIYRNLQKFCVLTGIYIPQMDDHIK